MKPMINETQLLDDLKTIILESKNRVIQSANSILTTMYWEIGHKINQETLKNSRAEYGKSIVVTLSRQLKQEFGNGFEEKNLRRMMQFATFFEKEKVVSLMRELSWSHFLVVLPIKDETQRDFYLQICKNEKWSVRTFRDRVNSMLYERTALSKKPDELIKYELEELQKGTIKDSLVLKDPYLLDFLDLKDRFLEKDLEDAILRQLEEFLLELGNGFSFIARQKRIQLDGDDYYIDLLFYNRKLKKLIAIDLKIGEFKPEYKGQMELYLRWLDKYEKQDDEQSPIGIILCTGKKDEQIELLEVEKSGIHVAEYLTVLPPKEVLQNKLHQAIEYAKLKHLEDSNG
ncbi:MAG: PDDEXK nuclease domain-containing protein [Sulfuricurvum sp.]|jgi:predicted nuclease of restriction endonuclease-like (RecB) superfamily|uniref:PDDEXK nuclease domain-containing protein n=1 Tax=Sulfuricurvum sp. TaxID=2025608 RepID=UPI0025F8ABDA|nr:PDDEXK nuclease domain-containing protein [Sulfuricurvum sp.]MCK9373676.1 PDDEXK nuclease domain-containing protein [Sulfuricurvum sp.]